jgi:hypothetical protein
MFAFSSSSFRADSDFRRRQAQWLVKYIVITAKAGHYTAVKTAGSRISRGTVRPILLPGRGLDQWISTVEP